MWSDHPDDEEIMQSANGFVKLCRMDWDGLLALYGEYQLKMRGKNLYSYSLGLGALTGCCLVEI